MAIKRKLAARLRRWADRLAPELLVAQPTKVERQTENVVHVGAVKADKTASWQPHQSGSVIVAEPPLVRAERLQQERAKHDQ